MAIGLAEQQIRMYGLPIRPSFGQPLPPKAALRKSLGMRPSGRAALIVGGGEGMGLLEPTASALAKVLGPDSQVVIICGRNLKLAKELQERSWPFHVCVKGARFAHALPRAPAPSGPVFSRCLACERAKVRESGREFSLRRRPRVCRPAPQGSSRTCRSGWARATAS